MLKFSADFCSDVGINTKIKKHITKRILRIMDEDMEPFRACGSANTASESFVEAVSAYFPAKYPKQKAAKEYLDLYHAILSDAEVSPKPLSEYAIKTMVRVETDRLRLCQKNTTEQIEDRDNVMAALCADVRALKGLVKEEDVEKAARKKLRTIEDMSCYEDVCTWSEDGYGLLDYFIDPEREF